MQLHLLVQATQDQEEAGDALTTLAAAKASPCIHFIETEPSVLRDVPWIQLREHRASSYVAACFMKIACGSLKSKLEYGPCPGATLELPFLTTCTAN